MLLKLSEVCCWCNFNKRKTTQAVKGAFDEAVLWKTSTLTFSQEETKPHDVNFFEQPESQMQINVDDCNRAIIVKTKQKSSRLIITAA